MTSSSSLFDPEVLKLVNGGIAAVAVVLFGIACHFALPVIKSAPLQAGLNPDDRHLEAEMFKSKVSLCKLMIKGAIFTSIVAMILLFFQFVPRPSGGSAKNVTITMSPEDVAKQEFKEVPFLLRGDKDRFLQGDSRQTLEVRDKDQLDFHVDKLYDAYRDATKLSAQQAAGAAAKQKKGHVDVAE